MLRPTRAAANGIWRMFEVSENIIDTTWPTLADPNFANVIVLVHGDDQESFAHGPAISSEHWRNCASSSASTAGIGTIRTTVSGPTISDAITPHFGARCVKVGNVGLACPDGASAQFGTSDFTIEGWFYFTAVASANFIDMRPTSASNGNYPTMYITAAGSVRYFSNTADRIVSADSTVTTNTWYHIAASRVSGTTRLYVAGSQVGSDFTDSTNYSNTSTFMGSSNAASPMAGYFQEIRVTRGVGRYSGSSLTVPTTKFPDTA